MAILKKNTKGEKNKQGQLRDEKKNGPKSKEQSISKEDQVESQVSGGIYYIGHGGQGKKWGGEN